MHETFQTRPFAFDRTFAFPVREAERSTRRKTDAPGLAQEVETLRSQIATLEQRHTEELARTRSEAFEAGRNHAQADRETAILSALDATQASLEEIAEQYEEMRTELAGDASELALAAAEAIAGQAIEQAPGGAIDEAIGRALAQVARGQEIEIKVNPDLVEEIETRIAVRQSGDRRKLALVVTEDSSLSPGDAVLKWERGGVLVDAASRLKAVLDEFAPLLKAPE